MPPQVQNHGLFLPILLSTDQSHARQQLLSQNMQKCMASNGVQSSAGLQAALPPVSGVTQTIPNTVVQNPNMQSIPGGSQNSVGNSMGQGNLSTMFANSQRQMPAMLVQVALCANAATYGISNATTIETIAITHGFVTLQCIALILDLF
ncbi:hypothetical protein POTOM_013188 [Populus tomentosa]|uniref:Uncharacterized protein n=1 Tax=Populus tomentosa TaxID=118781 RepID=A0A8X8D969_POPTO|nr:hypothetical protein POTOM_013188 [Populus tomentosa]